MCKEEIQMKFLTGIILFGLFFTSASASELTSTEKKQRKFVSRFYEALEMMSDRCPESVKNEYLNSVKNFEKAFPEFISLVNSSKFREYAITKFSSKSPVSENECLYLKGVLDALVNTEEGIKDMKNNTEIMRNSKKGN
jgi:hypothetical protein